MRSRSAREASSLTALRALNAAARVAAGSRLVAREAALALSLRSDLDDWDRVGALDTAAPAAVPAQRLSATEVCPKTEAERDGLDARVAVVTLALFATDRSTRSVTLTLLLLLLLLGEGRHGGRGLLVLLIVVRRDSLDGPHAAQSLLALDALLLACLKNLLILNAKLATSDIVAEIEKNEDLSGQREQKG